MPGESPGWRGRAAGIRAAVRGLLVAPGCPHAAARFHAACGAEIARAARAACTRFKLAADADTLAAIEAGVRELLWESDGCRARDIGEPGSAALRLLRACVIRAAGRLADERRKFGGTLPPPASAEPTNTNSAAHDAEKRELLARLGGLVRGESKATRWIFERYCGQLSHGTSSKRRVNISLIHRETGISRDCIRDTLWRLHLRAQRKLGVGLAYLPPRRGPRKPKPPGE